MAVSQDHAPDAGSVTSGQSHTPGPWAVSRLSPSMFSQARPDGGQNPIGYVYCPAMPERSEIGLRALADAHLIAAAPEAIASVRDLIALIRRVAPEYAESTVVAVAEAVLSKATGGSNAR